MAAFPCLLEVQRRKGTFRNPVEVNCESKRKEEVFYLYVLNNTISKAKCFLIATISAADFVLRHASNSRELAVGQFKWLAKNCVYCPTEVCTAHGQVAIPDWTIAR